MEGEGKETNFFFSFFIPHLKIQNICPYKINYTLIMSCYIELFYIFFKINLLEGWKKCEEEKN